jgi:hypothetical protein
MPENNPIIPVKSGTENKIVQTYAGDMAKVIEDEKGRGVIRKIIHGEEEHEKEKNILSPQSKKNKLFLALSLVLILVGGILLAFFLSKREVPTVPVEEQFVPLIFNDKTAFIEVNGLTKDQITQRVRSAVAGTEVKKNGVEGIYITRSKKIVGLREFIRLSKANFFPESNLTLVPDNFLLGAVNGETKDFFMIIQMRSSGDIFESLRFWEKKMFSDLQGLFGITLTSENKYLATKEFENGIIQNKNARSLYDNEGKIVMMYVFAADTSVIITNTENAAYELMLRLASSQIEK